MDESSLNSYPLENNESQFSRPRDIRFYGVNGVRLRFDLWLELWVDNLRFKFCVDFMISNIYAGGCVRIFFS